MCDLCLMFLFMHTFPSEFKYIRFFSGNEQMFGEHMFLDMNCTFESFLFPLMFILSSKLFWLSKYSRGLLCSVVKVEWSFVFVFELTFVKLVSASVITFLFFLNSFFIFLISFTSLNFIELLVNFYVSFLMLIFFLFKLGEIEWAFFFSSLIVPFCFLLLFSLASWNLLIRIFLNPVFNSFIYSSSLFSSFEIETVIFSSLLEVMSFFLISFSTYLFIISMSFVFL